MIDEPKDRAFAVGDPDDAQRDERSALERDQVDPFFTLRDPSLKDVIVRDGLRDLKRRYFLRLVFHDGQRADMTRKNERVRRSFPCEFQR